MFIKSIFSGLLIMCTVCLSAQEQSKFSLEASTGIGSYVSYSSKARTVYLEQGRSGFGATESNARSKLVPFVALHLNYQLSPRFSVVPFGQLQYHQGKIFKDQSITFGVTSSNPVQTTFSLPADHKLVALSLGTTLRYTFKHRTKWKGFIGAGLAYVTMRHNYRELLEVTFSEQNDPVAINEEFTTSEASGFGMPVTSGLDYQITDDSSIGIRTGGQFHFDIADFLWTAGLSYQRSF